MKMQKTTTNTTLIAKVALKMLLIQALLCALGVKTDIFITPIACLSAPQDIMVLKLSLLEE
jgi:hypothetical protein